MQTINIHEAKTHLSRLVEQAAKGESFIIAKAGKPLVKVTGPGYTDSRASSPFGFFIIDPFRPRRLRSYGRR